MLQCREYSITTIHVFPWVKRCIWVREVIEKSYIILKRVNDSELFCISHISINDTFPMLHLLIRNTNMTYLYCLFQLNSGLDEIIEQIDLPKDFWLGTHLRILCK